MRGALSKERQCNTTLQRSIVAVCASRARCTRRFLPLVEFIREMKGREVAFHLKILFVKTTWSLISQSAKISLIMDHWETDWPLRSHFHRRTLKREFSSARPRGGCRWAHPNPVPDEELARSFQSGLWKLSPAATVFGATAKNSCDDAIRRISATARFSPVWMPVVAR